jgi:DNA-binding transcriptional LysR family regulator
VIDPRINPRTLEAFYWTLKMGSFGDAGDKLAAAQSTITTRIEKLELGLRIGKLFDRSKKEFVPTEQGRIVHDYAKRLLDLYDEMIAKIRDPSAVRGTLRLGVAETIVHTWLPRFLRRMYAAYPHLELAIDVDISANLRTQLLAHKIDLAFMVGPVDDNELRSHHLCTEQLAFLASPGLGLAGPTSLSEIARHPVITFLRNTRPFRNLRDLFQGLGERPLIHTSASVSTIVKMAVEGLGMAVLPRSIAQQEIADGTLVEVNCEAALADLEFFAARHTNSPVGHLDTLVQMAAAVAAGHPA